MIKTEDGRGISGPYLNDIEHSQRKPPRGFLLQQFAELLDIDADLVYFLARQLPFDIEFSKVSEEQAISAYRMFRAMMTATNRDHARQGRVSK
jgi:hypothetical protein